MSTLKTLREVRKLVASMGMTVERVVEGKHLKLHLDTPSGKHIMVIARTASDARAGQNMRIQLRKWSTKGEQS